MRAFRRSLHYFEVISRESSVRRAAEVLHIAPSAVSRALGQLEEELGQPLFDRTPRGLQLTAAGETVLGYMRRWQRESEKLEQDVRSLAGLRLETVRIASVEVAAGGPVTSAVVGLRAARPGLNVELRVGHTQAVVEAMLDGTADMGIVINLPRRVPVLSLWTVCDPVGLVLPARHPLSRRRGIELADCLHEPLVLPDETLMSREGMHALLARPGGHRIAGTANRIGPVKAMVAAGLGVSFLTRLEVAPELESGRLAYVPLADAGIEHPYLSIVVPKAPKRSALVDQLIEALKKQLPKTDAA